MKPQVKLLVTYATNQLGEFCIDLVTKLRLPRGNLGVQSCLWFLRVKNLLVIVHGLLQVGINDTLSLGCAICSSQFSSGRAYWNIVQVVVADLYVGIGFMPLGHHTH